MTDINILLVEDNSRDALLVREALNDAEKLFGVRFITEIASDGEQALQVLYSAVFRPSLILLDLNLPKKTGLDVLREIKKDSGLRATPVIIFTNSRSEDDVVLAYASYCNAYVRKPLGFDDLLASLNSISQFWFSTAKLPKQGLPDSGPPSLVP